MKLIIKKIKDVINDVMRFYEKWVEPGVPCAGWLRLSYSWNQRVYKAFQAERASVVTGFQARECRLTSQTLLRSKTVSNNVKYYIPNTLKIIDYLSEQYVSFYYFSKALAQNLTEMILCITDVLKNIEKRVIFNIIN